jgi:hypothetical protein
LISSQPLQQEFEDLTRASEAALIENGKREARRLLCTLSKPSLVLKPWEWNLNLFICKSHYGFQTFMKMKHFLQFLQKSRLPKGCEFSGRSFQISIVLCK